MIFPLVQDFADALAAMPREHPRHRILKLLDEAIRRDVHFIDRHPTTFFQCIWNAFQLSSPVPPRYRELDQLRVLWRERKQGASSSFVWARSTRPPLISLGSSLRGVLTGHRAPVSAVAVADDQRRLASAGEDMTIRIWQIEDGSCLSCLHGHLDDVTGLVFQPGGDRLYSSSLDGTIRVWDSSSQSEIAVLRGHRGPVRAVACSPDGRFLASGAFDRSVRLWHPTSGANLGCLEGAPSPVCSLAFDAAGRRLSAGFQDGSIFVWELREARANANRPWWKRLFGKSQDVDLCQNWKGHAEAVNSLCFNPDGTQLISGSTDRTVRTWAGPSWSEIVPFRRFDASVRSVAYRISESDILVAAGYGVHRIGGSLESRLLGRHQKEIAGLAILPANNGFASGSHDATVRIWGSDGEQAPVGDDQLGGISCIVFRRDERQLATGTRDGKVLIWDAESGERLHTLRIPGDVTLGLNVTSLAWIDSDAKLMSFHDDSTARVWSIDRRELLTRIRLPATSSHNGRSPSGTVLYERSTGDVAQSFTDDEQLSISSLAGNDKEIDGVVLKHTSVVRRLPSGQIVACLVGHQAEVTAVALTADGCMAATADSTGTLILWKLPAGQPIMPMPGDGAADSLEFSPDGSRLAAGFRDGTVRVWEVNPPRLLARILGNGNSITGLGFLPDGRLVTHDTAASLRLLVVPCERRFVEVPYADSEQSVDTVPATAIIASAHDTVFEEYFSGHVLAWFPWTLRAAVSGPIGRTWAGLVGENTNEQLILIRIEGSLPERCEPAGNVEIVAARIRRGDWSAAIQVCRAEEDRLRKTNDEAELANWLERYADVLGKQFMTRNSRLNESELDRSLSEAERIWEKLGRPLNVARCLKGRLSLIMAKVNPQLLIEAYDRLEEIFRSHNDRSSLAEHLQTRGTYEQARRNYAAALKRFQEAEALYRELGNHDSAGSLRSGSIADVRAALGLAAEKKPLSLPAKSKYVDEIAAEFDSPTGIIHSRAIDHLIRQCIQNPERFLPVYEQEECQCRQDGRNAALLVLLTVRAGHSEHEKLHTRALLLWEECAHLANQLNRSKDRVQALVKCATLLAGPMAQPFNALAYLAEARRLVYDGDLEVLHPTIDRARRLVHSALQIEAL